MSDRNVIQQAQIRGLVAEGMALRLGEESVVQARILALEVEIAVLRDRELSRTFAGNVDAAVQAAIEMIQQMRS